MTSQNADGRTLVTLSEIARIAGHGQSAVSNWRTRSEDFPDSVARTGRLELFDLTEVMDWMRRNNKGAVETDIEAYLLRHGETLRSAGLSRGVTARLIVLAALHHAADAGVDLAALANGDTAAIGAIVPKHAIELLHAEVLTEDDIKGLNESDYRTDLPDLLRLYVDAPNSARLPSALVDTFMERLGQFGDTDFYSTPYVRTVMAALAWAPNSNRDTVFDPACGTGGLLAAAHREAGAPVTVHAADINDAAASMTRARFAAAGIHADVKVADTLADDPFPGLTADAIVCDPPLGLKMRDSKIARLLAASLGKGVQQSLDLAWAYYATDHLTPEGRAVLLTSPGSLFGAGSEATARFELLRRGCVQAVVSLPAEPGARSAVQPVLLVLRSPLSPDRSRDVLLIDATDAETWELDPASADIDTLASVVSHLAGREGLTDAQAATIASVPVLDLLAPGATLSPARWIATRNVPDAESRRAALDQRLRTLAFVYEMMDKFTRITISPTASGAPRIVTIGDLVDQGLIRLHRAPVVQRSEFTDSGIEVITTTAVTHPTVEAQGFLPPSHPRVAKARLTQPGDVVFAPIGAKAIAEAKGGRVPISPLVTVEQVGDAPFIDPRFLAAVLSGPATAALAGGATIQRVDITQIPIPLLSQEDAERLGKAFDNLSLGAVIAGKWLEAADTVRDALVEAAFAGVVPE